jgi:hypothetical protein
MLAFHLKWRSGVQKVVYKQRGNESFYTHLRASLAPSPSEVRENDAIAQRAIPPVRDNMPQSGNATSQDPSISKHRTRI